MNHRIACRLTYLSGFKHCCSPNILPKVCSALLVSLEPAPPAALCPWMVPHSRDISKCCSQGFAIYKVLILYSLLVEESAESFQVRVISFLI